MLLGGLVVGLAVIWIGSLLSIFLIMSMTENYLGISISLLNAIFAEAGEQLMS